MDLYTKAVLTVIAGALVVIGLRLGEPPPVQAGLLDGAPTVGDFRRLRDLKDRNEKQRARQALFDRIPMVRVQGGYVDVSIVD